MKRYKPVLYGCIEVNDGDYVKYKDIECMEKELIDLREKVAYCESMGLTFGIMKTSNRPEGFLQHVWSEGSDYMRMQREWMGSIGRDKTKLGWGMR